MIELSNDSEVSKCYIRGIWIAFMLRQIIQNTSIYKKLIQKEVNVTAQYL
jgi:hypothetical protein